MTRINLVKYGFVRTPDEDFSDDGNRFQAYRVGRVRVTKLVADGDAFINGSIRDNKLPYDVYSKLPHYSAISRLNGVRLASIIEADIQEFYEACQAYEIEYANAESSMKYPSLEELAQQCKLICAKRLAELNTAEALMQKHGLEAAAKFSAYEWKNLQEHLKSLINRVSYYDPDTYPQTILGQAYSISFVRPDNSDLTGSCYYYSAIMSMFKKYSLN